MKTASLIKTPVWVMCVVCLFAVNLVSSGISQTSDAALNAPLTPPTVTTRLEQTEATYRANLAPLHGPIIQEYITELEALKKTLLQQGRQQDVAPVEKELQKMRNLAAEGQPIPYTIYETPVPKDEDLIIPVLNDPRKEPKPTLTLPVTAATSHSTTTTSAPTPQGITNAVIPLGNLSWTVASLPAGNYDIMMIYATPPLTQAEPLLLTLGTTQLISSLPSDRATGSISHFQIFKLGSVSLKEPLTNTSLNLQSGNQGANHIQLKSVMFLNVGPDTP